MIRSISPRVFLAALLASSCGFEEPAAPVDGAPSIDQPPDTVDPTGPALLQGSIVSGGGELEVGTIAVLDDRLEVIDRSCAGVLCVTGGLEP